MHVHCIVKSRDLFLKFKFKSHPARDARWLLARVPMAGEVLITVGRYKFITQTSEKMDQDLYRKFIESNREQYELL